VQSWGYEIEVVAQMKFDIPKMYKFHKENNVDVDVDLIRVIVCSRQDQREE
jgi:predicted RNA methylase